MTTEAAGRMLLEDFFLIRLRKIRRSFWSTLRSSPKAQHLIESCEGCNPDSAEIPFDNILDRVTGSDPSVTDYVLEQAAKCPNFSFGLGALQVPLTLYRE